MNKVMENNNNNPENLLELLTNKNEEIQELIEPLEKKINGRIGIRLFHNLDSELLIEGNIEVKDLSIDINDIKQLENTQLKELNKYIKDLNDICMKIKNQMLSSLLNNDVDLEEVMEELKFNESLISDIQDIIRFVKLRSIQLQFAAENNSKKFELKTKSSIFEEIWDELNALQKHLYDHDSFDGYDSYELNKKTMSKLNNTFLSAGDFFIEEECYENQDLVNKTIDDVKNIQNLETKKIKSKVLYIKKLRTEIIKISLSEILNTLSNIDVKFDIEELFEEYEYVIDQAEVALEHIDNKSKLIVDFLENKKTGYIE